MSDRQDINAIFDRIANRNATDGDIQTLRQSVVIGGNAQGATIVTGDDNILGDNNTVQIGKYNINIAEGSNIKVGDTIYQGADAETIRAMLLEVLTDKIIIDSTFSRLFDKSESSGVDWDWGMKLLKQKQLPEIRKRLTDTLGRDRILMDVSIEEQQNWVNRSPLAADRTLQINGEDCGRLDANKMLIETFGRDDIEGKLLILGAPGAGKTTALLSLAEQLVYGAISQPKTVIPVIFELSTWQNDNQSIESWLIEQLYDLHGGNRKSKLYEQWLERQVLLPLLDGLDELGLERQKKCTEKLNEFAEHYPQMVVCCRVKEFEAVDIKLRNLRGAVCLQSLSDSQIQDYLDSLKRPELWEAIQTTPSLHAMLEPTVDGDPGLLRVPLFVKLVADVYDPRQPISSKADLLDKYIDRQLSFDKREIDRRKGLKQYKWAYKTVKLEPDWKKTRSNISWLAQNLQANNSVEVLIEKIQPSWLGFDHLMHIYLLIFGIFFGLAFIAIKSELLFSLKEMYEVLLVIMFVLIFQFTGKLNNRFFIGLIGGIIGFLMNSMMPGFTMKGTLFYALLSGTGAGIITGLVGVLNKIATVEKFQLSSLRSKQVFFVKLKREIFSGLIFWLLFWITYEIIFFGFVINARLIPHLTDLTYSLFFVLIVALITGLISTMKQNLKLRCHPNEGIWNSLQSYVGTTIITFLILVSIISQCSPNCKFSFFHASSKFISVYYTFLLSYSWEPALFIALIFGFFVGGGKPCLQHLSLRIVLWQSGLPWNFARFLNYCVERRLLLRVGGSYRFLHRELLDHFAQSSR
jgi:hypothetical protein